MTYLDRDCEQRLAQQRREDNARRHADTMGMVYGGLVVWVIVMIGLLVAR